MNKAVTIQASFGVAAAAVVVLCARSALLTTIAEAPNLLEAARAEPSRMVDAADHSAASIAEDSKGDPGFAAAAAERFQRDFSRYDVELASLRLPEVLRMLNELKAMLDAETTRVFQERLAAGRFQLIVTPDHGFVPDPDFDNGRPALFNALAYVGADGRSMTRLVYLDPAEDPMLELAHNQTCRLSRMKLRLETDVGGEPAGGLPVPGKQ